MHHPAPLAGVVTGVVQVGAGRIIFDQFAPPHDADGTAKRLRLARPGNRLRANLGIAPAADLLTGACTAGSPAASRGWPERLRIRPGTIDSTEHGHLLADCGTSTERLLTMPILDRGAWQTVEGPDGVFTVSADECWVYSVIVSPVARRNDATNLGVPNPEALTFADLTGAGEVELWVNGRPSGATALPGTLSDIALEQGSNHLLLRWTGGSGTLGLRFRNIMRQAEIEFAFP
jgi:hypothetical protein